MSGTKIERLAQALVAALGPDAVRRDQALARHTALRIGGPADLLAVADTAGALQQAVTLACEHGVPFRVLGAGSNILVSDAGVRGFVVLNRAKGITFESAGEDAPGGALTVSAESGAPVCLTGSGRARVGSHHPGDCRRCSCRQRGRVGR